MGDTKELLTALEAVVAADPRNVPVRLHLAQLLLDAGRSADSLEHARGLLGLRPTDRAVIELASSAADAAGESEAAVGYRTLLAALARESAPETETPRAPSREDAASSVRKSTAMDSYQDHDTASGDRGRVAQLRVIRGGAEESLVASETAGVTMRDVAGLDAVKRRLELAFLAPLRNPEIRRVYGKSMRGGLLLYGPPGCGKTFLARATAGELGARFLSVGLSDVLDMWLGQSERNLHELFDLARRQAPCVLFFDEIDALGRKRSLMRHDAGLSSVVNQFLGELDGVDANNEGVFVLAATNHPWDVDTALRRPGRLDRTLLVLPPDLPARVAILQLNLADRPTEALDLDWVASRTDGFSGADLAHLCESAVENAMEESLRRGDVRPVRQKDLKNALKELRPSTRPWFDTARNFALFSNEGGMYDDLAAYLREKKMV